MSAETVTLQDIYRARRTIAPHVRRTPLVPSAALSRRTGASVFLKLENLQETGAFKLRGATNRLAVLTGEERARGVVTVSTGNHGRAVAFAATRLNVRATVCMSSLVPANKVAAIRDSGAEVRIIGRSQDEAGREAERLVREEGMILVPPFDDPFIIAGQGTIGLELLEDQPDLDTVLVPLSGGGLIAGIAVALKAAAPGVRIVGISMKCGPAMHDSLKAGRPIAVEEGASLADSLGGGIGLDNRHTFRIVRDLVDDAILVDEDAIGRAMAHAYWQERQIIEGAAGVGIAALLTGQVEAPAGGTVACILSGANVAMDSFTDIVARHRPREEIQ